MADDADDLSQASEDAPAEPIADESVQPNEVEAPAVKAPQHWSQQDRDAFAALPDQLKPLYLEKVKSLESGWNRKFEEIAGERKVYEEIRQVLAPYEERIAAAGGTIAGYIGKLLAIGEQLETNPAAMIHKLADWCGVKIGNDEALNAQVQQLQAQLRREAGTRTVMESWHAFSTARDRAGNLLYPGAAQLRGPMGLVLQSDPPRLGETPYQALERAYKAAFADAYAAIKPKLDAEAAERQRKADLEKARRAGNRQVRAKTAPSVNSRVPAASWREELERQWDRAEA